MSTHHKIGIVGAGRVAQALALGLAPHAATAPQLWARSAERLAAATTRIGVAQPAPTIAALARDCDIIAIAVSDDALAAVTADLAEVFSRDRQPFVFHVSGGSGAAILSPLREKGALTAAVHPAMTFTGDPAVEVQRMATARFAVTGSTAGATARAKQLVALLGGVSVEIAEDRRALYHAALCHASNHLVTLISGASQALTDSGVDDPSALLAPLVRAALENSLARGFDALSGPLLRGDARTVGDHIDTLRALSPDLLPAYRAMAAATLGELERRETLPSDRLTALDSLLAVP